MLFSYWMPQLRELALKGGFCLERGFSLFCTQRFSHFNGDSNFFHQPVWWLHFSGIRMVYIPHKTHRRIQIQSRKEKRSKSQDCRRIWWVPAISCHPVWGVRTRSEQPSGTFCPPQQGTRVAEWLRRFPTGPKAPTGTSLSTTPN